MLEECRARGQLDRESDTFTKSRLIPTRDVAIATPLPSENNNQGNSRTAHVIVDGKNMYLVTAHKGVFLLELEPLMSGECNYANSAVWGRLAMVWVDNKQMSMRYNFWIDCQRCEIVAVERISITRSNEFDESILLRDYK